MVIKIKIIDLPNGNIQIKSIKALSADKLPARYLNGYPFCVLHGSALTVSVNQYTYATLVVGGIVQKRMFEGVYLKWIHAAGNRLHVINCTSKKEHIKTHEI
ncbi:hypothetical protein KAT92_06285 [Candidatus Babeliales bacterium]|nr:hypothetical protein [Candidatus Babeliales bacterium]